MAAFCAKCGAPLVAGAVFCGNCGAQVVQAVAPVQQVAPPAAAPSPWGQPAAPPPAAAPSPWGQQAPPPPATAPSPWGQPAAPPPVAAPSPWGEPAAAGSAPAKSGGGTKILLIVLGCLFLVAALTVGGVVWEVHRVVKTVKNAAADAGLSDTGSMGTITHPDACKYLSASDVSAAIGVTIVEARSDDSGCHYIAKGSADMYTAGHIAAMGGGTPPVETTTADSSSTDTTSLVDIKIDSAGGRTQMKVQKALIGGFGLNGAANGNVAGIGDEAFVIGNNQMNVRKGDMFIQIVFTNCPCAAVQIKPLAKKLVDQL